MIPPKYSNLPTRFWDKVDAPDSNGCWLWNARTRSKYGQYWHHGSGSAHRISAADALGPIPNGLFVLHHCDIPPCVNPEHLYFGTQQDNIQDMWDKKRRLPSISLGIKNGNVKLTEIEVVSIRQLSSEGGRPVDLAKIYNTSPENIHRIVTRATWRHV